MIPNLHYHWHVRCLTVPGPDTDLSLYVAFDNVRFLFGCGEGTQRAFVQKRVPWRGLSAIFIGSGGSEGRDGLPGLILTASDATISKLDIIGPADIRHHLATLRASVNRPTLRVDTYPMPADSSPDRSEEIYRCPSLTVRAVALRSSQATYRSRSMGLSSPQTAETETSSAPSHLSSDQLSLWCENIVRAMFMPTSQGKEDTADSPDFIRYTRPDSRYPLPLPNPDETHTNMVYICQAPPVLGKFDNKKATQLRVPNGPIRRNLVMGRTIEFEDNKVEGGRRIVKPEDVVSHGSSGSVLIVVNCTTVTLPALLSSPAFHPYQPLRLGPNNGDAIKVRLVVHRVPAAVWTDSGYQNWMLAFGDDTEHLIARSDGYFCDIAYRSTAWISLKLSAIDGDVFRIPSGAACNSSEPTLLPPNSSFLQPYHQIRMQPPAPPTILPAHPRDIAFPSDADHIESALRQLREELPDYASACEKARQSVRADPRWTENAKDAGSDIVVTTLGTGSALPSKYRNVSSTHLDIPGLGGILLDAGEGTLGQLRRRFGITGLQHFHETLRLIFISHMHADHHLGLQRILEDRILHGVNTTLYIVAPLLAALSMQESAAWQHGASQAALDSIVWLDNHSSEPSGVSIPGQEGRCLSEDDMTSNSGTDVFSSPAAMLPLSRDFLDGVRHWPSRDHFGNTPDVVSSQRRKFDRLKSDLGLRNLETPLMRHRGKAWGLVLEHICGWKIAYSGDTQPASSLIKAGRGATLLIHEATLEDDKAESAAEKGHSTFSGAIEVARSMGARHVLLTHFSQRYPKLPISASRHTMGEFRDAVISVSFDLMSICIGDMWRMSHYMDAIDVLLAGDEDEDEVEEGDDAVKAVERQTSASLSEIGGGLSTVTAGVKHGKGRRGETGSPAQIERKKNQSSPTKRESSPLRPVPDLKKVKADCDWPSAEIE